MRVLGPVNPETFKAFAADMAVHDDNGVTVLTGTLDQAALHGVVRQIEDLGLEFVDLRRTGA